MNDLLVRNEVVSFTSLDYVELGNRFISVLDVKPNTLKGYKAGLKCFFSYLEKNNITVPGVKDIINFKIYLLDSVKGGSVSYYLTAVRKFFSYLEMEGIYLNIAKEVKGAKFCREHKKDVLNNIQVQELLSVFDNTNKGLRDKAIVSLMLACGLRDIEVSRACRDDFYMVDGDFFLRVQGKGRDEKDESVFVPGVVYSLVGKYLESRKDKSNYLFESESNNNKGGMTTRSISRVVKNAFKAIGLNSSRLTAHSLRHTAITQALKNGCGIQEVQAFARHSNINTTMIYAHNINKHNARKICGNSIFNSVVC